MKKLLAILTLAAVALFARGQTNLTPDQEARRQSAQAMSEYLNRVTREAQANALSNKLLHPPVKGFGEAVRKTNNPVADKMEFLQRTRSRDLTNPAVKVIVWPDGSATVLPKKITQQQWNLLKQVQTNAAATYTPEDILPDPEPQPSKFDPRRAKQIPYEVLHDPVKLEEWIRSNRVEQPPKPKGSGGGDQEGEWTEEWIQFYSVTLFPAKSPIAPTQPVILPANPAPTNENPLTFPPLFGTNPVEITFSKVYPSLMIWADGLGTNQENHYFTNWSAPIQLDFHDVGHGQLYVQFPWMAVDKYDSFKGGRVEWVVIYDNDSRYSGTNQLMFEPAADWTAYNVSIYAPSPGSGATDVYTIRSLDNTIPLYDLWPPQQAIQDNAPPKRPIDVGIPSYSFADVLVLGSTNASLTNMSVCAAANSGADGLAQVTLQLTNDIQFWTVVVTNQLTGP